jgi:hypothetical protein
MIQPSPATLNPARSPSQPLASKRPPSSVAAWYPSHFVRPRPLTCNVGVDGEFPSIDLPLLGRHAGRASPKDEAALAQRIASGRRRVECARV